MSLKPSVSNLVPYQVPAFVREDNPTFVAFLQAYYEYLETQSPDLKDLRNLDTTLNGFINILKMILPTIYLILIIQDLF